MNRFKWKRSNIKKAMGKYVRPGVLVVLEVAGMFNPVFSRIGRIGQIMLGDDMRTAVYTDSKHGHQWKLKRTPSAKEWRAFDRRIENGEEVYIVLKSMRLI